MKGLVPEGHVWQKWYSWKWNLSSMHLRSCIWFWNQYKDCFIKSKSNWTEVTSRLDLHHLTTSDVTPREYKPRMVKHSLSVCYWRISNITIRQRSHTVTQWLSRGGMGRTVRKVLVCVVCVTAAPYREAHTHTHTNVHVSTTHTHYFFIYIIHLKKVFMQNPASHWNVDQ